MKKTWIIVLVVIAAVVLLAMGSYNGLVRAQTAVDQKWGDVAVQLQRRFDLVPNLQSIVEGAANFERGTLEAVTNARTKWLSAQGGSTEAQVAAANEFSGALARLLVTVESYPQLKATEAFRDFMSQYEGTENRIETARIRYNEAVASYNIVVRSFPRNLMAKLFGFDQRSFFGNVEGAESAPDINFNLNGNTAQ